MYKLLFGKDFPQLWEDMRGNPGRWLSRLVFLLGPWFAFAAVELLNQNSLTENFEAWQLLFNLIWYYMIFALLRLLLGRLRRAAVSAAVLCFLFGLVNHYVLRFRGRILFPADLSGWRTAANVLDGFDLTPDIWVRQAAIVLVVYLFLVAVCPAQKKRERLPRVGGAVLVLVMAAYTIAFFCTNMLPALNIYTQQWNTQKNGFLFNFSIALRYSRVEKPKDYSRAGLLELAEQFPAVEANEQAVRPTNLILVMNEAFSDLTIYEGLEVSENPTPFLHSMEENTIRGWLIPPVTGGGTAATEFEVLTGLSNGFLPPHCVAYQLYMNEDVPALSERMGAQGYGTTAFHPYRASGWNRPIVYEYMEFDTQLYNKDVEQPHYVRGYISDRSSYEKVFSLTEQAAGQPTFIFNVTMQNHSGYDQGWNNLDRDVHLTGDLTGESASAEQYLNLADMTDEAFAELIEYYENCSEPTIIAMFGDHQPPLSDEFFEKLLGKPESELSDEERMVEFLVPFVVWANYDIPEEDDVLLSSNYFGLLVSDLAGVERTPYMEFIADVAEALPVIHKLGFIDDEGQFIDSRSELDAEEAALLDTYEMLAYNYLFDREEGDEFFEGD